MKYTLTNIEDDDFVAEVLSELNYEICNGDNKDLKVIDTGESESKTKGAEIALLVIEISELCAANASLIENVIGGMIATGLYNTLKAIVNRLKKAPEYAPKKRIEIIQEDNQGNKLTINITIQDIAEKDMR